LRFRGLLRKFGFLEAADRQSNNYFLVDAQWQLLLLAIRHVTFDRHTQWLPTSLLMEHATPISARRTAVLKTSTANQAKSLLTDHNAITYRLACTLSLNKSKIFSLCVKMFQHQRQVPIQIPVRAQNQWDHKREKNAWIIKYEIKLRLTTEDDKRWHAVACHHNSNIRTGKTPIKLHTHTHVYWSECIIFTWKWQVQYGWRTHIYRQCTSGVRKYYKNLGPNSKF
jgi:hypothetical protein